MREPVRKVSIVIPVYNERGTLEEIVERVLAAPLSTNPESGKPLEREVILVDDGSRDGSDELALELDGKHAEVVGIVNPENRGKGYALRTGFERASGEVIIIQDADMEYDPGDYPALLEPIIEDKTDVVYGSRILGSGRRGGMAYYLGGRMLSVLTNLLYGSSITDEPTCYKVFRRSVLDGMELRCTGFEFCPEFTAKALKAGHKIYEVPIKYYPRSAAEGKKIRFRDGLEAIWTLLKYRVMR